MPPKTPENATKSQILTARVEDAKDDVSEERDERRTMTTGRISDLKDQIDSLQEDKDKLGSQVKWWSRMFFAFLFLVVVFFGVSAGVVRDGEINVPFLGQVSVGMTPEPESESETTPAAPMEPHE